MPPLYSGPKQSTLRRNLANVVTEGLETSWISEVGDELLRLGIVRSRLPVAVAENDDPDDDADEEALASALVAVLTEAVKQIGSRKYRRLLRCVLPLYEEYSGKSIKDRRIAAGQRFRDSKEDRQVGVQSAPITSPKRSITSPRCL